MKYRLVTAFFLTITTTFLTFVILGERSFSTALTYEPSTTQLSTTSPETTETFVTSPNQFNGKNIYLNSSATITATDVTTKYVFLPMVIKPAVPQSVLRVVAETNFQRSQYGCDPVTLNLQLTDAALGHSMDMALNDFFSHTGSDGSTPWERIEATGYQYSWAAENIAAGYTTPEDVMAAWMDSSGHLGNILNCDLEEIGVGYFFLEDDQGSENYHHYWTQVFATPR